MRNSLSTEYLWGDQEFLYCNILWNLDIDWWKEYVVTGDSFNFENAYSHFPDNKDPNTDKLHEYCD